MIKLLTRPATYQTLIRYALGLGMLPYGLTKIARTQFIVLPFHSWSEPLKDISGVTLTWAFLGYSPWFTVLLGFLEVIPAVLLLFRKTKLLGALLLFSVVLNVFLINSVQYYQGFRSVSIDEQDYVRYYFQPYQRAYQLIPDSDAIYRTYKLDEPQRTLAIFSGNKSSSVTEGSYKIINENTIEWTVGTKREKLWLSRRSL